MASPKTEEQILDAAKRVFLTKGYHGARMREIADEAGINKGLLHYYFKTKEVLFRKIFIEAFRQLSKKVNEIFYSDQPISQIVEEFIDQYIDFLIANPDLPSFVLHELHQRPKPFLKELFDGSIRPEPDKFILQAMEAQQSGEIAPINPLQLVMSLLSLCAFPFVAKPMFKELLQIEEKDYIQLMKDRKPFIKSMVLKSLQMEKI